MTSVASPALEVLAAQLDETLLADRHRLRRALQSMERLHQQRKPFDRSLQRFQADLEESRRKFQTRSGLAPALSFDPGLPITGHIDELQQALRAHQVLVVCGETGSGKSTQLPKICLQAGLGRAGMIGHTQPRRIAARSVAARLAEELGQRIGDAVAFKVRFTDTSSPRTLVKLMTDGILLAETQSDRFLNQYETLIIDEAHERSLNIDFLLGYLKQLLPRRPELKVIITSATIDAARFSAYFGGAPVLEVSGRTYPVEVRYQPPAMEEDGGEVDWQRAVADACEELTLEGPGDMLVFMPTERDIRETARVLQGRSFGGESVETLPLFGRLSDADQGRVFQPHNRRRIVIATNVAESSLTVPGIRFVVDPGTARISRYAAASQVQRLPIEPISRASANQRAGRCGRVGPGICVRLYSAEDFAARDADTPPELLRTNLASVLLRMKALQLGRIEDFPFLDPPPPAAVRAGLKALFELNAIDEREELTKIGHAMARLPVDPRIARMILAADAEGCLEEVLIIAAALEQRDPRDRPLDRQQAADEAHRLFQHETSDFLSLLKLWDFYSDLDEKLSTSKLRKACQQNYLSYNRCREWKDLHRQLREIIVEHGFKPTSKRQDDAAIHRAILTGLLSHVAQRGDSHEYTGAGGQKLHLWPGAAGFSQKPKWIMSAELVETSRRFARCIAPIQPAWIESLAGHLVKRTYSEPHWSEKQAAVMAWEKVLLFGLPVVTRRQCRYSPIEPALCRELFIQHALVEGAYQSKGAFQRRNEELKLELDEWQAKVRQGGHLLSQQAEFEFFDERLPSHVVDGASFESWRVEAELKDPQLLLFSRKDLLGEEPAAPQRQLFPDQIRLGTMQLTVLYQLDPGASHDGVTLIVPREGLNQLTEAALSWLVPGLLTEKVAALIKCLPKSLRTLFVPVPETAPLAAQRLAFGQGDLHEQLAGVLRDMSGEHVPVEAFDRERLPVHLRMNVRVIDQAGKVVAESRELAELRRPSQPGAPTPTAAAASIDDAQWRRDGLRAWDFGELPERITLQRAGTQVVAFPMLVLHDGAVALRLAETARVAELETRRALVQFLLWQDSARIQEQIKHLPTLDRMSAAALTFPWGKNFSAQLARRLAELALFPTAEAPRTADAWKRRSQAARNQYSVAAQQLAQLLPSLMAELQNVRRLLNSKHPPAFAPLVGDLQGQFELLQSGPWLTGIPWVWLEQYPRYLQAMQLRFQKAVSGNFQKDQRHLATLAPHLRRLDEGLSRRADRWFDDPLLVQFRFLLEEYRVSIFAQTLRTSVPVSEKRLNEIWEQWRRTQ